MLAFLSKIYDRQISSMGLGVFRIFFSLNLFFEVFQRYEFRHLYYDYLPYIKSSIISNTIIWYVWFCLLIMLILGVKTRIAACFNYMFILAFIVNNGAFEYHMDYTYTGVSFLMVFLPISKSYSLDNLILRIKYSSKNKLFIPIELTSKFYYYLIIIVGIGFVYFDSVLLKLRSQAWLNGLGLWLPASLPPFTLSDNQWVLNQEYFIKGIGYFTIIFELSFLFIFWIKKIRSYLFIIGFILHIGILVVFPIPYFALGVAAVYLVLIPVCFWNYLENLIRFKTKKITFYYDEECPLCLRTKIIITFFDVFKAIDFKGVQSVDSSIKELQSFSETELLDNIYSVDNKGMVRSGVDTYFKVFQYVPLLLVFMLFRLPGLYQISKRIYRYIAENRTVERCTFDNCVVPGTVNSYIESNEIKIFKNLKLYHLRKRFIVIGFILLTLLQFNSTIDFVSTNFAKRNIKATSVVYKSLKTIKSFSHFFLGITKHGVFLDGHYVGYDEIYTLKYKDEFLPFYNDRGQPDVYLKGGIWANFNFRVNHPYVKLDDNKLLEGFIRYSNYYSRQKDFSLNDVEFFVYKKKFNSSFSWEKDLLKENLKQPWVKVGTLKYKNNKAVLKINEE